MRFRGCLVDVLQGLLLRRQLQHETSRKRPSGGPLTAAHRGRCFNQQLQHRPRSPLPFQPLSLSLSLSPPPPSLPPSVTLAFFHRAFFLPSSSYLLPPPSLSFRLGYLPPTQRIGGKPTCAPEILRFFFLADHENKVFVVSTKVERQR